MILDTDPEPLRPSRPEPSLSTRTRAAVEQIGAQVEGLERLAAELDALRWMGSPEHTERSARG